VAAVFLNAYVAGEEFVGEHGPGEEAVTTGVSLNSLKEAKLLGNYSSWPWGLVVASFALAQTSPILNTKLQ
jgi:hypothetical protein